MPVRAASSNIASRRLRAAERLFHRRQADRSPGPTGDPGLHPTDVAAIVETDNGGGGGEREIAMPPGDLDKGAAGAGRDMRNVRGANVLALGESRFERAGDEARDRQATLARSANATEAPRRA